MFNPQDLWTDQERWEKILDVASLYACPNCKKSGDDKTHCTPNLCTIKWAQEKLKKQKTAPTNGDLLRNSSDKILAEHLCKFSENSSDYFEQLCTDYNDATNNGCQNILEKENKTCGETICANSACPIAVEWWLKQKAKTNG